VHLKAAKSLATKEALEEHATIFSPVHEKRMLRRSLFKQLFAYKMGFGTLLLLA
jgi:hypothetical protein